MPAKKNRIPKLRHHKATGQGFVEIDRRWVYLGSFGSPETTERYHRLMAEWVANGRRLPAPPEDITVAEVVERFWEHAKTYYRKPDGSPTSEVDNYRQALRPLVKLYGPSKAAEFGPLSLIAVQHSMIGLGWSRRFINAQVSRIKSAFKWAVAREIVAPSISHGLITVPDLKRGRSDAREIGPVRSVPEPLIEAVRPHVSRQVWAMVQLQLLTGMSQGRPPSPAAWTSTRRATSGPTAGRAQDRAPRPRPNYLSGPAGAADRRVVPEGGSVRVPVQPARRRDRAARIGRGPPQARPIFWCSQDPTQARPELYGE